MIYFLIIIKLEARINDFADTFYKTSYRSIKSLNFVNPINYIALSNFVIYLSSLRLISTPSNIRFLSELSFNSSKLYKENISKSLGFF